MNAIFTEIKSLEERLELPSGFYTSLLDEDDWSFIIKISSLFEAASTNILSVRLNAPEIEGALSYLEQANGRCGKIIFLKKLGVIEKEQQIFMLELASLRNHIVHRIENVKFDFSEYIKSFDKNQRNKFINWCGHGIKEKIKIKDITISRDKAVLENPKLFIWLTAAEILACLYLEVPKAEAVKTINKLLIKSLTNSSS